MTPSLAVLLAVFAAAFASMAVYVVRGGSLDRDAEGKGAQLLFGAGDFLMHWFLWAMSPAERAFLRLGVVPDHLNLAGLLLGLGSGLLIASARLEAAGWAIVLAGVCDILDGRIARALKLASPYGKFIDSTIDRFVETFVFMGFAWYLRATPFGAVLAGAALAASLLVSYAQARGETVGVSGAGGLMQRAERMVLTFLACLFDGVVTRSLAWPEGSVVMAMLWIVAGGAFATSVHRTLWIARRLKERG